MITPIFLAMIDLLYDFLRTAHSVRCGRENAAGIAGALTAGIEPAQSGLTGLVAQNAHRGTGTRLHCGEHRVGGGVAVKLALKQGQSLLQRFADEGRQTLVQIAPADGGTVGRRNPPCTGRGPVGEKIADGV